MLLRNLRERLSHVPSVYLLLRLRAAGDRVRWIIFGGWGPHLPPSSQVHCPIAGDPVEPGREARTSGIERSRLLPDFREGVLDHLFGKLRISQKPESCCVHGPGISIVEFRESPLVAPRHPAHQVLIAQILYHGPGVFSLPVNRDPFPILRLGCGAPKPFPSRMNVFFL